MTGKNRVGREEPSGSANDPSKPNERAFRQNLPCGGISGEVNQFIGVEGELFAPSDIAPKRIAIHA